MRHIYQLYTKKLNRRVIITMYHNEEDDNYGVVIHTRRLIDKRARDIKDCIEYFSLESIMLLSETLKRFFEHGTDNKVLMKALKDYNNSDSTLRIYKCKEEQL